MAFYDCVRILTLTVGANNIAQSTHIRSLGLRLDAEHTIEPQMAYVCKTAYFHMKQLMKSENT